MQTITILGLALCLAVLYRRARKARKPSSTARRFKTARLLVGALLVWLVISLHLRHLNHALSGEPQAPESTWDRVIQTLSNWGI